ncbi:50S ribosomal protein L16 [Candidatus Woesebacteria bacterium RIFCSPLOWO2_01_FULL_39_23]|uniref:Large ribosomal subunit protein uL16 n=3 Tax=Microgenomates group TaxID=1794810 RepID=A0A0H4TC11_9BACT|nr:50S ribosomal protein L16, large subunit ribosomal protein L16 [uncultured Microgenomates bacterium Rifle_16ft_4_minimus_37633]AKQ05543.1 50S ribosomal protein L16, large subunit ribosomal protein L16 [uncultured Microgenomates bacterium Rifle_16ft_4_minimus_24053]OGM13881.1 MAG: 50S ribosomal protein L16 [Candidatus Woesebacteria bacterium RBG_16_40_11]OGM27833.1 MAG: 50S ribosomal protein L16 [Candidatus Woesebacteria bacterium RIFCSPHIGHO2_01_FULL_40_22]OGM36296.1 MAG: 50S ribosomal prote
MLEPKRRKFRKDFRGRRKGQALRGYELAFGEFGLKALEVTWLSGKQIEAGRRAITHSLKRGGRVWIRVFPDKPVTSRPAGQRMGSGKGDIDRYVAVVRPGKIIYEVAGATKDVVVAALKKAADKMPVKTKIIMKAA